MLSELLIFSSRVVAVLGALGLVWLIFLVYEDEEKKLASKVQKLSKAARDLPRKGTALVIRAANGTLSFLDRLLGAELISLRAVSVSLQLCVASAFLWWSFLFLSSFAPKPSVPISTSFFVCACIILWTAWQAGSKVAWRRRIHYTLSGLFAVGVLGEIAFPREAMFQLSWVEDKLVKELLSPVVLLTMFLRAAALSVVVDLAVISAVRVLARRAVASEGQVALIAAFAASALLGVAAVIVLPTLLATYVWTGADQTIRLLYAAGNILTLLPSLVFAVLAGLLLVDSLILQMLARSIHAVHRFKLLERRMQMAAIAVGLLTWGIPTFGEWLWKVWAMVKPSG